jgi:hypothetical protein
MSSFEFGVPRLRGFWPPEGGTPNKSGHCHGIARFFKSRANPAFAPKQVAQLSRDGSKKSFNSHKILYIPRELNWHTASLVE